MAFPGSGVACLLTGLGTVGKVSCHSLDRKGQFDHANTTVAQEISPLVEWWKEVHSHQASKVTSGAESEFVVYQLLVINWVTRSSWVSISWTSKSTDETAGNCVIDSCTCSSLAALERPPDHHHSLHSLQFNYEVAQVCQHQSHIITYKYMHPQVFLFFYFCVVVRELYLLVHSLSHCWGSRQ